MKKENIETTQKQLEEEQTQIKEVKAKNEQTSIVLSNMQTLQLNYAKQLTDSEKKIREQITAYKKEQAEIEAQIQASTNYVVSSTVYWWRNAMASSCKWYSYNI